MLATNPRIETPPDDSVIWRYMDLERFLALLTSEALHLCRIDCFRDPWEGSWPQSVIDGARKNWQEGSADQFMRMSDETRKRLFVSCWHESANESAALWDLYTNRSGVAIQSSVGSLRRSISDLRDYFVGRVRYVDFDKEPTPELNVLVPPFLKRKSFEHEKELRVLYWQADANPAADDHSLKLDTNVLIERLYVSPTSPPWLVPSLERLCARFGISAKTSRSSLYDPRVY